MENKGTGLYFEEFKIGDEFRSEGRTITEFDIEAFAELSGDFNQIHTNVEYAKGTIYGERIAHGLLGLSVVSGLAAKLGITAGTTIALRDVSWKFRSPVKIGDTLEGVFIVDKCRNLKGKDGGIVVFRVIVTNQKNEKVQTGKWAMVIKNKT